MMTLTSRGLMLAGCALALLACADADTEADMQTVDEAVAVETVEGQAATLDAEVAKEISAADALREDQDISTLPAGRYEDEDGHAYIAFSYSHQGFSNPILRFNGDAFEAVMELNPDAPTETTLSVEIDPAMIDSGVSVFNEHLVSGDMFDVANHPDITFTTTSLSMDGPTSGVLLGDLTMKGITKPVALDVTLNKVGQHFRSGNPMFGVSATGRIKRSEWDLGYAAPAVGDDVDLMIEVEFQKSGEE